MSINPDKVPTTMVEAVQMLVESLPEEQKQEIREGSADAYYMAHHGFGTFLRNRWSFWEPDTPIKRDCVKNYGIAMADDMSGLLLAWAWATVRGEKFVPLDYVEVFHRHWANYDTTSLAAGHWKEDGSGPI